MNSYKLNLSTYEDPDYPHTKYVDELDYFKRKSIPELEKSLEHWKKAYFDLQATLQGEIENCGKLVCVLRAQGYMISVKSSGLEIENQFHNILNFKIDENNENRFVCTNFEQTRG
jgi:hypothetical protein